MKEALERALEALEILKQAFFRKACLLPEGEEDDDRYLRGYDENEEEWVLPALKAITAIKATLAQPTSGDYALGYAEGFNDACKPAQPAQQHDVDATIIQYHEATIKRLEKRIEELAQAAQQEPVAWLEPEWGEKICPEVGYEVTMTDDHPRDLCWIPLYTHPPQRTWVELTDEEILKSEWAIGANDVLLNFARAIEAKLKEKNNG